MPFRAHLHTVNRHRRLAAGGGPSAGLKSKRSAHMGAPLAFSPVSPVGVSIRYPAFR